MQLDKLRAEYVSNNQRIQSIKTVRLIRVCIRNFEKFLGRSGSAADLTDEHFQRYITTRRADGRAASTIDGEIAKLLALKRYAAIRGLVPHPLLRFAKSQTPTPVAFMRWQLRRLWHEAHRSTAEIGGIPGRVFWPAILDVVWDSGERIWAVYTLQRNDVDLRTRWVTFRERKGNGRVMHKRLRRATVRSVRRLLHSHDKDRVFGVVCLATVYNQYEVLLAKAGLPTDRHSKFHCLRKSHASYLHVAGGNSRESLGHTTEAITIRHYHDPRIVTTNQPADLLFHPASWYDWLLGMMGF